jgi:hypothetical protein
VSAAALADLRMQLGEDDHAPPVDAKAGAPGSEARQQSLIRLDAAEHRVWLTRNNVGALLDERGVPVRYGLANESKAQNKAVKSADLIGIRRVLIGPHHVGMVLGQFVSIECKEQGWTYNPRDKHTVAQAAWRDFVLANGGFATFATGPGAFDRTV